MTADVLLELAAAIREEAQVCIAPVHAAFVRLAERLEARAAELTNPEPYESDATTEDAPIVVPTPVVVDDEPNVAEEA